MFRPNRIGTPKIWQDNATASVTAFTMNTELLTSAIFGGNVINAAAQADFGRDAVYWTAAARTIPLSAKWCIGQQFTVTQPISGDTVGLELNGGLLIHITGSTIIQPFVAKVATPAMAAQWDAFDVSGPTLLMQPWNDRSNLGNARTYRDQVVLNGSNSTIAGTYVHGFCISESATTPAAVTFTHLYAEFSVRQLNDQQDVSYRDTRR